MSLAYVNVYDDGDPGPTDPFPPEPEALSEHELPPTIVEKIRAAFVEDCDVESLPDPVPLVERWLTLDSLAVLFGPPGLGKSFVAVDLAYRVAYGMPWFDSSPITSGPVVYVAAEGTAGLKLRRRAWLEGYGRGKGDAPVTWLPMSVNLLDDIQAATVADEAARREAKLVVIDTLNRTSPGGDEGAEAMGRYVRSADRIREATGACVLVVHHVGKDATRGARGHSSLEGASDTMLELDGSKSSGRLVLSAYKQKDLPDGRTLHLVRNLCADSCVIALDRQPDPLGEGGLTQSAQVALAAFDDVVTDAGISNSVWIKSLPDGAMTERTFYRARRQLIDAGEVRQEGARFYRCSPSQEPS